MPGALARDMRAIWVVLVLAGLLGVTAATADAQGLLPAGAAQVLDQAEQPGPGREPLLIESTGRRQWVRLESWVPEDAPGQALGVHAADVEARCWTPCTLYLPTGRVTVSTGGSGLRTARSQIWVPLGGVRVRMRAAGSLLPSLGRGLVSVGVGTLLAVMLVRAGTEKAAEGLGSLGGGDGPGDERPSAPLSRGEKVALAGAAVAIGVGLPLWLFSRKGVASRQRLAP